jgi:hypothetical protein
MLQKLITTLEKKLSTIQQNHTKTVHNSTTKVDKAQQEVEAKLAAINSKTKTDILTDALAEMLNEK